MENIDKQKIAEIARRHGLKLLLVFGSQASGKTHKFSDFDFGFVSKEELSYADRGNLNHDLSKLVKSQKVEDVDLAKAGPFLLKEIVKNNKILFEDEFAYEDFFSYAVRTYLDASRLFELQDEMYVHTIDKYKQKLYAQ